MGAALTPVHGVDACGGSLGVTENHGQIVFVRGGAGLYTGMYTGCPEALCGSNAAGNQFHRNTSNVKYQ